MNEIKPYTAGIVGGMGPLAGVYFQQLIIEATPAKNDQDHVPVICYTNPAVPDRNQAFAGEGEDYVPELTKTVQKLASFEVSEIFLTCNAAHRALPSLEAAVTIPIYSLISGSLAQALQQPERTLTLLATTTSVETGVYQRHPQAAAFQWQLPDQAMQAKLMDVIYAVKRNELPKAVALLQPYIDDVMRQTDTQLILGCTELSVLYPMLTFAHPQRVIDPLRVAARYIVDTAHH